MKKVSTGIAFLIVVFLGDAISENYIYQDGPGQYQSPGPMFTAESGGNPWAIPDRRQQGGQLPGYITNPRYPTREDIETNLNRGDTPQNLVGQPQQQMQQQTQQLQQPQQSGYGGVMGSPQIPSLYSPYSGMLYGYPPAYQTVPTVPSYQTYPSLPTYPGMGAVPGVTTPYMGNITGFGGNPLLTPYGNIYGNVPPYQQTIPQTDNR